jgi:hypothetical protein
MIRIASQARNEVLTVMIRIASRDRNDVLTVMIRIASQARNEVLTVMIRIASQARNEVIRRLAMTFYSTPFPSGRAGDGLNHLHKRIPLPLISYCSGLSMPGINNDVFR